MHHTVSIGQDRGRVRIGASCHRPPTVSGPLLRRHCGADLGIRRGAGGGWDSSFFTLQTAAHTAGAGEAAAARQRRQSQAEPAAENPVMVGPAASHYRQSGAVPEARSGLEGI